MHDSAAAAGHNLSSAQLALVEQLVEQAAHLHASACDLQKKLKISMKGAADDRAALITSNKKLDSTQKKFNEAESKLKQYHATSSKATASASPSKKRVHIEEQKQEPQQDSRRRRIDAMVHPDRRQHAPPSQEQSAPRPVLIRSTAPASTSALERSPSGKVRHPAERCLVAAGVNVQAHLSNVEALQIIKQTLFNLALCREADMGQCTPVDVYKLQGPLITPPIKWKIVFRSAAAADMVLERYMYMQAVGDNLHGVSMRAFANRHEHAATAADALEPEVVQQRPESCAVTQQLDRTVSSDSVLILDPPVKAEVKVGEHQLPVNRIQFVTRHALSAAGHASVPPVSAPSSAVTSPAASAAALPPQQQPVATPSPPQPPQQQPSSAIPYGWIAYPQPQQPMIPNHGMMHHYYGAPQPHGVYMQHLGGPHPYSAPMGYAPPAGYMPAPVAAYPFHPQLQL